MRSIDQRADLVDHAGADSSTAHKGHRTVGELIESISATKNPALLASIVPELEPRRWRKGQPLLRQGQPWNRAYFVEKGVLRMHLTTQDGQDFNKSFWAEGTALLPLTRQMAQAPSLFGISVLEPSTVWEADAAVVRRAFEQLGAWHELRAMLLEILLTRKLEREHDLLTLDGRQRYEKLLRDAPGLATRIPLVHLASYLGMTDVSLSRIRRQLRASPL